MSRTTFSGPILSGDVRYNQYKDVGNTVLNQNITFDFAAGDTVTGTKTLYVPANTRIVNIQALVVTAYNAGTSSVVSIGKAAAGTEYVTTLTVSTAGLVSPTTITGASWLNTTTVGGDISSSVTGSYPVSPLAITLTLTGTVASAGKINVVIQYIQSDDRNTALTA